MKRKFKLCSSTIKYVKDLSKFSESLDDIFSHFQDSFCDAYWNLFNSNDWVGVD